MDFCYGYRDDQKARRNSGRDLQVAEVHGRARELVGKFPEYRCFWSRQRTVMKYLLTSILTVLIGLLWIVGDSFAASRGSYSGYVGRGYKGYGYRGHVGSGWHRTHALPRGKRTMIPKGGSGHKKFGRGGVHLRKKGSRKIFGWPYQRHHFQGKRKHLKHPSRFRDHRKHDGPIKPIPGRLGFRRFRSIYPYAPIYYPSSYYAPTYYPPGTYAPSVNIYPYDDVILDGILKGEIGGRMGEQDQFQMAQSTHTSLESAPEGSVIEWHNPDSDFIGTVSPLASFRSERNEECREFQQSVTFDGVTEVAYGTACRVEKGGWKIASY